MWSLEIYWVDIKYRFLSTNHFINKKKTFVRENKQKAAMLLVRHMSPYHCANHVCFIWFDIHRRLHIKRNQFYNTYTHMLICSHNKQQNKRKFVTGPHWLHEKATRTAIEIIWQPDHTTSFKDHDLSGMITAQIKSEKDYSVRKTILKEHQINFDVLIC